EVPVGDDLTRGLAHLGPTIARTGQAVERGPETPWVGGIEGEAVDAFLQEVLAAAALVGHDDWKPARHRLVDGQSPRLTHAGLEIRVGAVIQRSDLGIHDIAQQANMVGHVEFSYTLLDLGPLWTITRDDPRPLPSSLRQCLQYAQKVLPRV